MKRKSIRLISLVLSMAMLFSLVSFDAFAVAGASVSLNKTSFTSSEEFSAVVSGLTDAQVNDQGAYIGIYTKGTKDGASAYNSMYSYVEDLVNPENTWKSNVPSVMGTYEVRLIVTVDGVESVLYRTEFTVGSSTASTGNITMKENKLDYLINEKASVTIKGITQGQKDNGAWVGLFKPSDKPDANAYNDIYTYIEDITNTDDTWTFEVPNVLGTYELRVFTSRAESAAERTASLYGTQTINVISNKAQFEDITINKKAFYLEEQMLVTIEGLSEGQLANGAWAGIYKVSDKIDASPLNSVYIEDFRDGATWEGLTAPATAGVYEIRVYTQILSDPLNYKSVEFSKVVFQVFNKSKLINWSTSKLAIKKIKTTLAVGKKVTLNVYAVNLKTKKQVTANSQVLFASSDSSVAAVTPEGVIVGISPGTAEIHITADDNHTMVLKMTITK